MRRLILRLVLLLICDLDGWCCLGGWEVTCRNYYSSTCVASCP